MILLFFEKLTFKIWFLRKLSSSSAVAEKSCLAMASIVVPFVCDYVGGSLLFGVSSFFVFYFFLAAALLCALFFPFAVAVMCALILCLQWDGWEKFFAFQIYSPGFKRARVWLVCVFWREWMYVCLCMFV